MVLRQIDLNQLDGHNSFICFFMDGDTPSLFLPYAEFEQVIRQSALASDGQYKVQVSSEGGTNELYIPRVGRFNIDAYGGIEAVRDSLDPSRMPRCPPSHTPKFRHSWAGSGICKGYGVYIPPNNIDFLDWQLACQFPVIRNLPQNIETAAPFAGEIDVVWLAHGRDAVSAAFEVEHSTPVYSGLLKFNDVLLTCPVASRFFIVSNELRRDLFARASCNGRHFDEAGFLSSPASLNTPMFTIGSAALTEPYQAAASDAEHESGIPSLFEAGKPYGPFFQNGEKLWAQVRFA